MPYVGKPFQQVDVKLLKSIFKITLRLAMIILLMWMLVSVGLVAAIHFYGQADHREPADVIIVLGAGLRRDGRPGPALVRRARWAAQLWQDGYAPNIICTGGVGQGFRTSEAEGCRDELIAQGVPADAILLEMQSRSTEENAMYTHAIMNDHGWTSAVLVSDAYHLLRAQWIFIDEGITVYPSSTVNPPIGSYVIAVAREVAALHWYGFKELFGLQITYLPTL